MNQIGIPMPQCLPHAPHAEIGAEVSIGEGGMAIDHDQTHDPDQTLDHVLSISDVTGGRLEGGWELSDDLREIRRRHLEPRRELAVTLEADLRSIAGVALGRAENRRLTTRDQPPTIGFASRGSLLPSKLADGLPVVALNVDRVDVEFFRIRPERVHGFLGEWGQRAALDLWQLTELPGKADLVHTAQYALDPAPNTRERIVLPLDDIAPLAEPGVYLAVMRQSGSYRYSLPVSVFTRSDLGLSLRRTRGALDAFVQSLEDGAPQVAVTLQLLDRNGVTLASADTGADGHARLPTHREARLVTATRGNETSLIRLGDAALDLAEFAIDGPPASGLTLFAFGPRDLYRPGETVPINALLRDADGHPVPAQPIPATLVRPDGETAREFIWQAGADGLYQYHYPLAPGAQTGRWQLRMELGHGTPVTYGFLVEDFLPERLALEIQDGRVAPADALATDPDAAPASLPPLAPADDARFRLHGRYLYGAPAAGNTVLGQWFVAPLREAVPALPGFQFGDATETLSLTRELDEHGLDGEGHGEWILPSEWSNTRSPLELTLQASVQESGGRAVTRRMALPVWPAGHLVGIRPLFPDGRSEPSAEARFELVVANAQGERLAASGIEIRLVQERRDYFWQFSEHDGWTSEYAQTDLVRSTTRVDVAADDRAEIALPVDWGWYRIEATNPETGLRTSMRFFAGYRWQESSESGNVRPDQVRLALDRPRYRAGDTAVVTVEAPAAGEGYLLVESADGPLWWQPIQVPADGARFELPLAQDWARHDLYVSALIVRPGSRTQHTVPRRAVGLIHLPLDREDRRIALELDTAPRTRPNQPLTVTVSAPAHAGQSVRVLVSAVDVGILNLTNFETPDPFDRFFGQRGYGVDHLDIYGQLIEVGQARRAGINFGGDQDAERGGRAPISSVTLVALQAEPVTLDADGRAEIRFDIPDFNGELRLMAQAWSDRDYGVAEARSIVAAPLVMELAAPRFLAGHDRSQLALDLTNLTDAVQTLQPEVRFDGLITAAADADHPWVTLQPGERHTLRLPVTALSGIGDGGVHVTVSGLDLPGETLDRVSREWRIGVRPAWPAVSTAFAAALPATETTSSTVADARDDLPGTLPAETAATPVDPTPGPTLNPTAADARAGNAPETAPRHWSLAEHTPLFGQLDAARVTVTLSSTPPLDLAEQIRELFAYPYGCAEQTTSGLYPSLYAHPEQLATLGIRGDAPEQRRTRIETGIERLLGMQRINGSFGLWGRDGVEEYWLTVYVTDFLLRAVEEGFAVPPTALNAARNRLLAYLQNPRQIDPQYTAAQAQSRFAVQAYAAYVLARTGQAPLGALRQLHQQRTHAPSGLALAQLGFALQRMGDGERADALLRAAPELARAERFWIGDYGSTLRDLALTLALYEEHALMPRSREALYLRLAEQLREAQWLSTQERNAVFLAGRHALTRPGARWQAEVDDGQPRPLADTRPRTIVLRAGPHQTETGAEAAAEAGGRAHAALSGPDVRITNQGDVTLYQRVTLSGYPRFALPAEDERIAIERRMLRLDGSEVDGVLSSGELVLVHLTVRATARIHDALIVDLLPAGLELENQRLDQSARLPSADPAIAGLLQRRQQTRVEHEEFLGDRYAAAVDLPAGRRVDLLYLARAVTPGTYRVPPPLAESMYNPAVRGRGATPADLEVRSR